MGYAVRFLARAGRAYVSLAKSIRENQMVVSIYLMVTLCLFYQQHAIVGWDFAAYVLNAKYFLGIGSYFELMRPPLASLILGLFMFLGSTFAQYAFILAVSTLFMVSAIRLADALRVNRALFYLFSLTPYALFFAIFQGTEMLSLAFLNLFLACLLEGENGGYHLGFGILSRYTNLSFAVLLLFYGDAKKAVLNALYCALPIIPWMVYNYFWHGNVFASVFDSYLFNVKFRAYYINQPMALAHFGALLNILAPLVLLGLFFLCWVLLARRGNHRGDSHFLKCSAIMLLIALIVVHDYASHPFKLARYLFNLVTPISYFAVLGVMLLSGRKVPSLTTLSARRACIMGLFLYFLAFSVAFGMTGLVRHWPAEKAMYGRAIAALDDLGVQGCALQTNSYVYVNYLGQMAENYPRQPLVPYYLNNGYNLLIFKGFGEPEYSSDYAYLYSLPLLHNDEDFVIIGNNESCGEFEDMGLSYLESLYKIRMLSRGQAVDFNVSLDRCFHMFDDERLSIICSAITERG